VIFISHSAENMQFAEVLRNFLAVAIDIDLGDILCTCVHHRNSYDGEKISEHLKADISSCTAVIAIVTPESISTDWLLFEIGAAWALGKKLFFLFLEGVDFRDLPEPLNCFSYADIDDKNAPIQLMGVCREAAAAIGAGMKRGPQVIAALDRVISTMRRQTADDENEAWNTIPLIAPERAEAPDPSAVVRAEKWGAGDYCEIVCNADSAIKRETIKVRILWDDLFKALAPNIRQPRDESFVESLFLDLCMERDSNLRNGAKYKLLTNAAVTAESFTQIISRLSSLGYIRTSQPPHTIFQRSSRDTFWKVTPLGEDYLRELIAERRKIGI
jgi:hypothetical protein